MAFLFFVSGFAIPLVGIFFLPLSVVSITLIFLKNGIFAGILGIILSSVAVYKLVPSGYLFVSLFGLVVVLNSVLLYSGVIRKRDNWHIILFSSLLISVISVGIILALQFAGFQMNWIFSKIGTVFPKEISELAVTSIVSNIYAITVIFTLIITTLSYISLSNISAKLNITNKVVKKLPAFYLWRLPEKTVFLLIFVLFIFVVFKQLKIGVLFQIADNLLNIILFVYFVGGLSAGKYLFNSSKVMVAITYFFFFLYPPVGAFLGISDVWLNFRARKKADKTAAKKNGEKGNVG
ncbi:MAG: DUF2232 domain-containing protein [Elusimicrobiota bacterium]